MLNIILFGPPGAGKGTQANLLVENFGFTHISTGDLFRFNIGNKTELGLTAQKFMNQGKLVPDEITINMLEAEIAKHPDSKGFLLDGFPRTVAQAEALDAFFNGKNEKVDAVISLDVAEDELRARLKNRALTSGRADDAKPEVIQKRLDVYKEQTEPVKSHYSQIVKSIDGIGSIEEVANRTKNAIDSL